MLTRFERCTPADNHEGREGHEGSPTLETVGDYTYYFAIFAGITIGAVRSTRHAVFYDLGFAALGGSLITAFLLLLLRQRMTAAKPERFGAAGKAHFVSGGAGWARFLAWSLSCSPRLEPTCTG
jgi:hypothetical protein